MPRKPSLQNFLLFEANKLCDQAKEQLKKAKGSLAQVGNFNALKADYTVHLRSLWSDYGEVATKTNHFGKLADAIPAAEKEFMEKNKRGDVQADYLVTVRIGEMDINVPKEYWQGFKRKRD